MAGLAAEPGGVPTFLPPAQQLVSKPSLQWARVVLAPPVLGRRVTLGVPLALPEAIQPHYIQRWSFHGPNPPQRHEFSLHSHWLGSSLRVSPRTHAAACGRLVHPNWCVMYDEVLPQSRHSLPPSRSSASHLRARRCMQAGRQSCHLATSIVPCPALRSNLLALSIPLCPWCAKPTCTQLSDMRPAQGSSCPSNALHPCHCAPLPLPCPLRLLAPFGL